MASKPPRRPLDPAKIAAILAGESRYSGNDCRRRHGGLRYASTGHCVLCHKLRERGKEFEEFRRRSEGQKRRRQNEACKREADNAQ